MLKPISGIKPPSKIGSINKACIFKVQRRRPINCWNPFRAGQCRSRSHTLHSGRRRNVSKVPFVIHRQIGGEGEGNDEAEVEIAIDPTSISFPANRTVTDWLPITTMFRDLHVTSGANVWWSSKQVLTRYRFRANVRNEEQQNQPSSLRASCWNQEPGRLSPSPSGNSSQGMGHQPSD